jgi:hypothetical protein
LPDVLIRRLVGILVSRSVPGTCGLAFSDERVILMDGVLLG